MNGLHKHFLLIFIFMNEMYKENYATYAFNEKF